jgi:hypothetical protein
MADEELERFEAMLGALSSSLSGDSDDGLTGARCPKCEASSFVRVSELYDDAVRRLSEGGDTADVVREGGKTDSQIVERLGPPQRRSARGRVIAVAVPLAVASAYLYRRFGDTIGQASIAVALIATVIVFLTRVRRLSDEYYARRHEWNRLFMCRRCGQLIAS